jgi:hypothetical protein
LLGTAVKIGMDEFATYGVGFGVVEVVSPSGRAAPAAASTPAATAAVSTVLCLALASNARLVNMCFSSLNV